MEDLLSIGFSSADNERLQAYLTALDFQLKEITGNPLLELRKINNPHPIFFNIRSASDIELLKKLITDFDKHFFACGLSLDKRNEFFLVNQIKEIQLFFLPLDESEIKALITQIKTKFSEYQINMQISQGLKKVAVNFELQTQYIHISTISRQLTSILDRAGFITGATPQAHINLALEEALTNSLEHGNLELDSGLKPNSLFEIDQYELLKQQRLKEKKYANRKITINILIYIHQAEVRITDQGPGFNTSILNKLQDNPEVEMKQILDISGKGMLFIRKAFDSVEYRKQGREIVLIKKK